MIMAYKTISVLLFSALLFCGCSKDTDRPLPVVGDPLPEFTLTMDDGSIMTSREISEAAVGMIVFFHTLCPDCRRELPIIDEFHKKHPEKLIVAVSRTQEKGEVAAFWADSEFTLRYSAQKDRKIYSLFSDSGIPYSVFVRDGIISALFSDDHLFTQQELEVLLSE